MRALQLNAYEGPRALVACDVPEPPPGPEHAVVEVRAIGINFPDLLMTKGMYQLKPDLPVVPGCEISGVIRTAPADSGWEAGESVAAFVWTGGYAEQTTVPLTHLVRLPDGFGFEAGAASLVNYHTVLFALERRGGLGPGERLLVLGAGGGIGTAAIQVGRGLGAYVLAGVANEEQRAVAAAAGADETLLLGESFSAEIRERTSGRGVDVVLDPLGDWLFLEGLRSLAHEGRLLVVGFAAGDIPTVKVNRLLLNNTAVVGVAWGATLAADPQLMARGAARLTAMIASGTVRPAIGLTVPFAQIPDALERLASGDIPGKGVAVLASDGRPVA